MTTPIKTLSVIADGEPCALRDVLIGRHVVIDGTLYWFHGGNHCYDEGYLRSVSGMNEAAFSLDTIVQPVRIEEVDHG